MLDKILYSGVPDDPEVSDLREKLKKIEDVRSRHGKL